jgi:hypothetical protein
MSIYFGKRIFFSFLRRNFLTKFKFYMIKIATENRTCVIYFILEWNQNLIIYTFDRLFQ